MQRWLMPLVVTTPKNTTAAAPQSNTWPLWPGRLYTVRVQIPPGHNGRTGLAVTYQGTRVMPWSLTNWLIGSGDTFTIAWEDEIMSTGWQVLTYNTDSVAHTFYLYADVLPDLGLPPADLLAPVLAGPGQSKHHPAVTRLRRVAATV